jgi:hypothetical protein
LTTNESRRGGPRPTRRVAYGFLALDSAPAVEGDAWRVGVQRIYRVQRVIAWGSALFEALEMQGENQLVSPAPAAVFQPQISIEYVASRFFDPPLTHRPGEVTVLIAAPLAKRFELELGVALLFPTLLVGDELTVRFQGQLRGLLLIGEEIA